MDSNNNDINDKKLEDASWSTLTIGDNINNREKLLNNLKKQLQTDLKDKIKDAGNVKKNVRAVWVGNDADAFITEFNNRINTACDNIDGYYTTLENRLKKINDDWQTARETNKRNIEGSAE